LGGEREKKRAPGCTAFVAGQIHKVIEKRGKVARAWSKKRRRDLSYRSLLPGRVGTTE